MVTVLHIRMNESNYFFFPNLSHSFDSDMVSKCDLCNRPFKRPSQLGRHVRIVHENQRHECGICHKLFTRQYKLTKHEKLHTRVFITIYGNHNIVSNLIVGCNIVLTH